MQRISLSLIAAAAISLSAQAQVGPGVISPSAPSPDLTFSTGGQVPASGVAQVSHVVLPKDAAGVWTTCMSVTGLSATYGSAGGYDLLLGSYDRNTGTYTPNNLAAALNSSGTEFGLMLDPTGLHAVFDRDAGVFYSTRASQGVAFGAPVQVAGITATYVDPSLGYIGGKLTIIYALNNDIVMQPLDVSNPAAPTVTGTPTIIAKSAGGTLNSPTPISGPDGDVEGLYFASLTGSDNDMCWASSLDPNDGWVVIIDTADWINNGGVAGGLLTHAGPANAQNAAYAASTAWILGDTEPIGGTADICGAFVNAGTAPGLTLLFMAPALRPAPFGVPGIGGEFGLQLTTFSFFGAMAHVNAHERGALKFPIPQDPNFKGFTLWFQGLAVDTTNNVLTLTNTAPVHIQ
jgi:hypothetical protein